MKLIDTQLSQMIEALHFFSNLHSHMKGGTDVHRLSSSHMRPVVIAAVGGSGTRVVARITRHCGYFLGKNLNRAEDSQEISPFLARHANDYLLESKWIQTLNEGKELPSSILQTHSVMVGSFREVISRHRLGIEDENRDWGWKNPRSILVLPFIHSQYPELSFVHVIRDGRDMAYSTNQQMLRVNGHCILSEDESDFAPHLQSIIHWSKVNTACSLYAEKHLVGKYFLLRFEDLCSSPRSTIGQLFGFLGHDAVSSMKIESATAEVAPPDSLGRWKTKSETEIRELNHTGAHALQRFGYLLNGP